MNDPHVIALVYTIEHDNSIDYKEAKPFYRDEQAFRLEVADEMARFEMHSHFPTFEEADKTLAEYLRAWEFEAQLKRGPDTFHLVLDRGKSELIDRKPTQDHVRISGYGSIVGTFSATLCVKPPAYPVPPSDITLTPDVETMYNRYMGYREGREPLAGMANFCLTILEDSTREQKGRRLAAARMYNIDEQILSKIGDLSANRGGAEARKADGVTTDFSPKERHFLEQAIKAIIRRVAQRKHTSKGNLSGISWSDLPPLNNDSDSESKTKE